MAPVILDTDTLSLIMRQDAIVLPKARSYLAVHQQFTFTIMTRYEILRGLKARNASKQLENFNLLCSISAVLPLTDEAIVAASAIVRGMKIITNNERHFQRIPNLQIENWKK